MFFYCRLGEAFDPEGGNSTHSLPIAAASSPIHLDDVSCTGKEPSLLLCVRSEWLHHDCTHQEDVSITCNPQRSGPTLPDSKSSLNAGQTENVAGHI